MLIVGMMRKVLAGDVRGISAALLERLRQTMTQVRFALNIISLSYLVMFLISHAYCVVWSSDIDTSNYKLRMF